MDQQARLKLPLQIHGSLGSVYLCIVECIPGSWFFGGGAQNPAFSCHFRGFWVLFLLVCTLCIVCIPLIKSNIIINDNL
jgi:hypothetical protein